MSPLDPRDAQLLGQIDERTKQILNRLDDCVTHDEFSPVKKIVYGTAGLALTAVAVALIALVVFQKGTI